MQNPISYLICATERTGSYFLCDALALTGIAGRPQECFHPDVLARLLARADYAAYAAFFEQIVQEGTTPNGVFGAKIQWWQLKRLVAKLRELPEYRGIGAVELLQSWLPNVRYIRLTRRDKLRQAVSWLKAAQTAVWWEMTTKARTNTTARAAQPTFDFDKIDRVLHRMLVHEAAWQLFFDTCGIQPLDLVYEDLVQDYAATALQVLNYLQIPVPEDLVIAQPRYKKQADDVSEQWVQRYHELKAAQADGAPGAAPTDVSRENREIIFSQRAARAATAGPPLIQPLEPHGNVVYYSPALPGPFSSWGDSKSMKITAYPLYDHAAALQPASEERAWIKEHEAVTAELALSTASGSGWALLCPYAFEATWNGGPAPEDIAIRIDTSDAAVPPFVQSQLGGGLLTFYPGYQIQTAGPHSLWVRGPINAPKDGLSPLEQIVDTSVLPCTITVTWTFTRPHQTVQFAQGEPFGLLLPYPQHYLDQFEQAVVRPDDAPEVFAHELRQRIQVPAMQDLLQRLQQEDEPAAPPPAAMAASVAPASRWAAQLSNPPPVSCICPTYGRVALLEEAIESFLRQDYPGQKELIVLNDYAAQTLEFDHPEVRIVNLPQRFRSVGEKYKAAVALCSHELIVVWHDDDIYLPHRLSVSVAQFQQRKGFFKAGQAWFWNDGQLSGPERNTFHGGSCFSRELFVETQGYPHVSNGFDIGFELLCEELRAGATKGQTLAPEELYYIYRWAGTGSYHLSAAGQNGEAHAAVAAYVREQAEQGRIATGPITLNPHWNTDYTAPVRDYLSNGHARRVETEEPFPPPFFVIPGPQPLDEAAASLFRGAHPARMSVILPALNESVLLQRTVEQFEATLPADCEIIVVDNGSTDGSADFLAGRGCTRVTLIQSAKPLGVAGARNRGLEAAHGEVIVFADAHIDLPEHWWQPVVATLNRPNVGVVGPGIGIMGKPERNVAYAQRIAEPNLRLEWLGWKQKEPYPVPTLGGGFMAMRRETLNRAGAFDCGMPQWGSEDLELCVRYWLLGYEVWVVPDVTILHYFRKENPLKVKSGIVTHNVLRVALLHFNQARIGRVVSALREKSDFGPALAHAVDSDVWQRRAEFAACRVRDDDWFFEQFKDSCMV